MENNNYEQMKVSSLKNLARERGLRGYYKLRKSELIKQIKNPPPLERTRAQLIQLAKERGLRRYSGSRKSELLKRPRGPGDQTLGREIDARIVNVSILAPTPYKPPQQQATPAPSPSSNSVGDLIDFFTEKSKKKSFLQGTFSRFLG